MGWSISPVSIVIFASAFVAIAIGLASLRKRPDPMAWPLAVLMFAAAAWAVPHGISLGFTDVEQVAFWHKVRYPGTVLAPVAYLIVALKYAGYEQWLSRRVYTVLAGIPALTIIAVWTNPSHNLFWKSLSIARVYDASVLLPEFGPLYWLNLGYLYLLTLAGLVVLATVVIKSGPIYRKQAILMFIGGVAPLAANMVVNLGSSTDPTVDFTTTVLVISGLTFALALFHFDLLEVSPVARDLLIEELDDGVVVVGPEDRIRDFNPRAARILGDIELEQPADEILPSDVASDGGEMVAEIEGKERLFHTRSSVLEDKGGGETGRIVYLNDVTEILEREQRISVLNRILRHNIRNELNVVAGRLELLEERVSPRDREHIQTANKCSQRVIEFAEKARHIEKTLNHNEVSSTVCSEEILNRVVNEARERYPNAALTYESTTETDKDSLVSVVDDELFEISLAEILENAIVHADREPEVTARIDVDGNEVSISIADNGPTIPDRETRILNLRTETDFDHGSGLGLWLVKWTISLSSGDLSFTQNSPRGNVITVTLPLVAE